MRRCISSLSLSGSLEDKIIAAAQAGYAGIEIFREDIVGFPGKPEDIAQVAKDEGIAIVSLQSLRDFEGFPAGEAREAAFVRAARFIELAARLEAEILIVCTNTRPEAEADPARAAADIARLADMAAPRGLTIGYEPLASSRHVRDIAAAGEIVRRAGRANLGLVFGALHFFAGGGTLDALAALEGVNLTLVHLADAPTARPDPAEMARSFRLFPGQGVLPLEAVHARLAAMGYDGPVSLEAFSDETRALPPREIAQDGMRAFGFLTHAPRAAVRGVGFVEFTCQGEAAAAFKRLLGALGFVPTHRSRDGAATLFRAGDNRLVVNERQAGLSHSIYLVQGFSVSALGLVVEDATVIGARVARDGGLELPMVRGPGGSVFYLMEQPLEEMPAFAKGFEPVSDAVPPSPLLTRIDHLAQAFLPTMLFQAQLFLRATFDFTLLASADVLEPHGTVRSRTLTAPGEALRFTLNTSLGAGTTTQRLLKQGGAARYHHIAFATDDIFAVAERLGTANALPIPGNYYDDLLLRFEIDPALLDRLRRFNLLYDRDEGGEYFQLYTQEINGFFFEVVERRGYRGLGAPNAPVRMLVQSRQYESAHLPELM